MTTTRTLAFDAIAYHQGQHVNLTGEMPTPSESVTEIVDTIDSWIASLDDDPQLIAGVLDLRAELLRIRYASMAK